MAGEFRAGSGVRPRRDLRWIAAGVLSVCLGGLGAALLYANISTTTPVITIVRTVYRDQVITQADLGVTSAVPPAGVDWVGSERVEEVVGQTAQFDLVEGSLLSPRSYGAPIAEPGRVRLGLRLTAGRIPAASLPPGARVLLVPVGREGADPPSGASVTATIATAASVLADGASIVDVSVIEAEAERVARLAAGDQLVLLQLSGAQR